MLGTALASVVSWSDAQIIASVAPGSSSGVAQVQQGGVWSNAVSFAVLTPVVAGVAPLSGAVGDQITITGSGFGGAQGTGSVLIGSGHAKPLSWTDSQIVITVPPGAASGNVLVQQGGSWSNAVAFTVNGLNILSVSPASAVRGAQVAITGSSFGAAQGTGSVWLGTSAADVVSWSDTQIVATVAQGSATGSAQVLQNGVWSNPVSFEVIAPKITAVTPNPAGPGATVTVTGSGFGPIQNSGSVWLGSAYAQVLSWSDTQIIAAVASTARTGVAKVQQDGIWSNSVNFSVPLPPGALGVNIVPSLISMVVGETRPLQAFLPSGAPAAGLTWQVSDSTVAGLSTSDPPTLTALLPGHVTVIAGDASADLTVYPGPTLPIGTVKWSAPGDGSGVLRIIPAVPSDTGVADVFALQASGQLQAITAEGQVAWTANVGAAPNLKLLPDFQGGLVTVTPQSLMRLEGMTGQPQGLYFSTAATRDGISSVVPHTDGTVFAIDGDTLVGINPVDGTPRFSIAMEHSTTDTTNINGPWGVFCASFADPTTTHTHDDQLPAVGNLIIAGDGYAYVAYQYSTNTYTNVPCIDYVRHQEQHLRLLRVSSNGDSSKISVKDWASDFRQISDPANPWTTTVRTQNGIIPAVQVAGLITNADQGVMVSWGASSDAYTAYSDINGQITVPKSSTYALTPVLGGNAGQEAVVNIPNQWAPIEPMLQSSDGTYFGNVYVQDPVTMAVSSLVVATNVNGAVKWSVPGDDYTLDHVAADGTLVVQSASRGTLLSLDPGNANANAQAADPVATYSWIGAAYPLAAFEATSFSLADRGLDGSFGAIPGGNHSGTAVAIQQVQTNQQQTDEKQLPDLSNVSCFLFPNSVVDAFPPGFLFLTPTCGNINALELLTDKTPDFIFQNYIQTFRPGITNSANRPNNDVMIFSSAGNQPINVTAPGQKLTITLEGLPRLGQGPFSVLTERVDPANYVISVVTLKGHPLAGWRYWRVYSIGTNDVVVETGAYDQPGPGPKNYVGYYLAVATVSKGWKHYLEFIQNDLRAAQGSHLNHLGGHTETIPQRTILQGFWDTLGNYTPYILDNVCQASSCH